MKVQALSWLGVKTAKFYEMVHFYQEVLSLSPVLEQPNFAIFRFPNGDTVEIFGHGGPNEHLTPGMAIYGFSVDNIEQARQELVQAGLELIGPLQSDENSAWQHFRGPDGNIYELNSALEHK